MRAIGRLCVLLCALTAVLPAAVAQAKITPLPKPPGLAVKPGAVRGTALIAPVSRPTAHRSVTPAHRHVARAPHRATTHHTARAPRHRFVPVSSHGGRERPWRVLSAGGREAPAVPLVAPTPLALVGAQEMPADTGVPWPAWKIVLLVLLGLAEGLVLFGLVRGARFAGSPELI